MKDTIKDIYEIMDKLEYNRLKQIKEEIKEKAINILKNDYSNFIIKSINCKNKSVKVIIKWEKAPLNLYI